MKNPRVRIYEHYEVVRVTRPGARFYRSARLIAPLIVRATRNNKIK